MKTTLLTLTLLTLTLTLTPASAIPAFPGTRSVLTHPGTSAASDPYDIATTNGDNIHGRDLCVTYYNDRRIRCFPSLPTPPGGANSGGAWGPPLLLQTPPSNPAVIRSGNLGARPGLTPVEDLVVSCQSSIIVYRNSDIQGIMAYDPYVTLTAASNVFWSLEVFDAYGSGSPNAVVYKQANDIFVLLSLGGPHPSSFAFSPRLEIFTESTMRQVTAGGDLNGDGTHGDILAILQNTDNLPELLLFPKSPSQPYAWLSGPTRTLLPTGAVASSLVLVDLLADGSPNDAIVADTSAGRVLLLQNSDNAGTWIPSELTVPSVKYATLIDLSGDGIGDLVVTHSATVKYVDMYLGPAFAPTSNTILFRRGVSDVTRMVFVDTDGDGGKDMAIPARNSQNAFVVPALAPGVYSDQIIQPYFENTPSRAVLAPLDGVSGLDAVVSVAATNRLVWYAFDPISRLFQGPTVIDVTANGVRAVQAANLAGSASNDIAAALVSDSTIVYYLNTDNADPGSRFASKVTIATGAGNPFTLALFDFDGDGDMDVVYSSDSANALFITFSNGALTPVFTAPSLIDSGTALNDIRGLAVGDVTGDGNADLVVAAYNGQTLSSYAGDGTGGFGGRTTIRTSNYFRQVKLADLDNDGDLDLVFSFNSNTGMQTMLGNGAGSFSSLVSFTDAPDPYDLAVGDFDGSGVKDVALVRASAGSTFVYLSSSPGTLGPRTTVLSQSVSSYTLAAGDVDGSGVDDLVVFGRNQANVFFGHPSCSDSLLSPPPPPNTNAWVSDTPEEFVGSLGSYGCSPGFVASPPSPPAPAFVGTCGTGVSGWAVPLPTCVAESTISCGSLSQPDPTHGSFSCTGTTAGDQCTLTCNSGYGRVGLGVRVCGPDGIWSGSATGDCVVSDPANMALTPDVNDAKVPARNQAAALASLYQRYVPLPYETANNSLTFTLQTRSSSGIAVFVSSDVITVDESPSASASASGVRGAYKVTIPKEDVGGVAGRKEFHVRLNGVLIWNGNPVVATLLPDDTVPIKSTAEGNVRLVYTSQTGNVTVTARDKDGNARLLGGDNIAVDLRNLLSSFPFEVVDNTDGTYGVTYTLSTPGLYTFIISMDGNPIDGSPYVLSAESFCPRGFFSVTRTDSCSPCGLDVYTDEVNQLTCKRCPLLSSTHGVEASSSVTNCTCVVGTYSLDGPGTACTSCPQGASCPGFDNPPIPIAGFGQVTPGVFAPCPIRGACIGGTACAAGYEGFLCSVCASGYYSGSDGTCAKCPDGSAGLFSFFILLLILAAAVGGFALYLLFARELREDSQHRSRLFPPSLSMVTVSGQIMGLFAVSNFSWSSTSERMLRLFTLASLDVNLFATRCSTNSYAATYLVSLFAPAVLCGLTLMFVALYTLLPRYVKVFAEAEPVDVRRVALFLSVSFGALFYVPLSRASFELFDCSKLNGRYVLDADLSVVCFDSSWWALFPFGLLGLLVYVIGIPLVMSYSLWKVRDTLWMPETMRVYGLMYRLFRRDFYFTGIVLLGKRLVIVVLVVFLSSSVTLLIASLLVVVVASMALHNHFAVYYFTLYDLIEQRLNACVLGVLLCAFVSHAGRVDPSEWRTVFIEVVLIAIVILFIIVSIWAVWVDIKDIYVHRTHKAEASSSQRSRVLAWLERNTTDLEDDLEVRAEFEQFFDERFGKHEHHTEWGGGVALAGALPVLDGGRSSVALDDVETGVPKKVVRPLPKPKPKPKAKAAAATAEKTATATTTKPKPVLPPRPHAKPALPPTPPSAPPTVPPPIEESSSSSSSSSGSSSYESSTE